jgi:hypothetical protein
MYQLSVFRNPSQQLSRSSSLSIIQKRADVDDGLVLRQIMLARLKYYTTVCGFSLREFANGRDFNGERLKREVFCAWETAT